MTKHYVKVEQGSQTIEEISSSRISLSEEESSRYKIFEVEGQEPPRWGQHISEVQNAKEASSEETQDVSLEESPEEEPPEEEPTPESTTAETPQETP